MYGGECFYARHYLRKFKLLFCPKIARPFCLINLWKFDSNTLISLINVDPTLTNFGKFHPPQKNPPSKLIDYINTYIPTSTFIPASTFSDLAIFASIYCHFSNNLKIFTLHKIKSPLKRLSIS